MRSMTVTPDGSIQQPPGAPQVDRQDGRRAAPRFRDRRLGRVRAWRPLDNDTQVRLGREYLEAGYLDHGSAITAHRARGATVDRVSVLGSEELSREWGYIALSRHREQLREQVERLTEDEARDALVVRLPVASRGGSRPTKSSLLADPQFW